MYIISKSNLVYFVFFTLVFMVFRINNKTSAQKIFTEDLKKIHTYTAGYQMPFLIKPEFQYGHGYTVGFEYIIKYKEKNWEGGSFKIKGTDRHLFLNNALGGYINLDSTSSQYLHTQLARRITWRSGFKLEGLVGIGYIRTYPYRGYYDKKTHYFKHIKETGNGHFMTSLSTGIGWDFYRCWKVPVSLNIRPGMYFQFPGAEAYKPYFNLEGSVSLSIYKRRERTWKQIMMDTFKRREKHKSSIKKE